MSALWRPVYSQTVSAPSPTLATRVKGVAARLMELPWLRRILGEVTRVEAIDRSIVIAAQAMFSVTPLLVVAAAFMPSSISEPLSEQLTAAWGMDDDAVSGLATADEVRTETGLIGLLIVIISALSFARAMQRLYERVWEQPHVGGLSGNRRCLVWMVSWVLYLQIVAVVFGVLTDNSLTPLRIALQVVIGAVVWCWTAYTLLSKRVPWRALVFGAVLTSVLSTLLIRASGLVMPEYTDRTMNQFGSFGLVFAISSWLIVFGGIIVAGALLGRVITEEPRLHPPFTSRWLRSTDVARS